MKACIKRSVLLWLIYFLTLPINIAYTDNINLIPPSEKIGAPNGSFSEEYLFGRPGLADRSRLRYLDLIAMKTIDFCGETLPHGFSLKGD